MRIEESYRANGARNDFNAGGSEQQKQLNPEQQQFLSQKLSNMMSQVGKSDLPSESQGVSNVTQPTGAHGVEQGMQDYKNHLNGIMDSQGIQDPSRRAQIMGFAMMEGAKENDLDRSKDGSGSANGPMNINQSVLRLAGEQGDSNTLSQKVPGMSLDDAVKSIDKAIDNSGLENVKRAQRGGQTTLDDGKSYDYQSYSQNYDYTVNQIQADPSLQKDDRRIWTQTGYV